jgi:hypothetical protein
MANCSIGWHLLNPSWQNKNASLQAVLFPALYVPVANQRDLAQVRCPNQALPQIMGMGNEPCFRGYSICPPCKQWTSIPSLTLIMMLADQMPADLASAVVVQREIRQARCGVGMLETGPDATTT